MKQLTLRGFDDELRRKLEDLARSRSISLNKAALLLLRRGAGLGVDVGPLEAGTEGARPIGNGLDRFIGAWSAGDERELLEAIADLRRIDRELWS